MLQFNTYYHIYNYANGDDNLFREQKNYPFFMDKYHQHIDPIAETIAWCLMPNHFHLLVKIKNEAEVFSSTSSSNFSKVANFRKVEEVEEEKSKFLSKKFSNFFSSYSQAFNKVYNRRGSLFIKNFKRKEITNDYYLRNLILYIHLNPIKHGFTKDIHDWYHTSFTTFPSTNPQLLKAIFDNHTNYNLLHQNKQIQFHDYDILEHELT